MGTGERIHPKGARSEHRPRAVLVGRVGRGRVAPDHGPAEEDHPAVQAAGDEKVVPGVDSFGRHGRQPAVHKKTGDGILDTLFIRGRHYCINTWVSTQKLRLMPSAVRVNTMWYCVFRLRNQLELDALVEELSAMLPKDVLFGMYQEATREKYSFWHVNLRAPKEDMFWVRFDRKFLVNEHGDDPQPGGGETAGERPGVR